MGYPPFYPYPTPGVPQMPGVPAMGAAADIPALLASMGMQVPEIAPVAKKEQPKQRAELGALSFKLPAAPAEEKEKADGVPLATLAAPAPAPFMDVSNVLESPSPTKPPPGLKLPASPVRRAATP